MTHIEYFKLQAKNLFKDFKTQTPYFDEVINDYMYEYHPQYFDVDEIVVSFDLDEDDFSLMNAQHIIALIAGFRKWSDLLKASTSELELAKLLIDNRDILVENWEMYIANVERDTNTTFDDESRLELFKKVFLNKE